MGFIGAVETVWFLYGHDKALKLLFRGASYFPAGLL